MPTHFGAKDKAMTLTFQPHASLPNRIVALSEGGSHLALIITRNNGDWYEVHPFVNWIGSDTFESVDHAQRYIQSCADHSRAK